MKFVLYLLLLFPLNAYATQYQIKFKRNLDASKIPQRWEADFNNDGHLDHIRVSFKQNEHAGSHGIYIFISGRPMQFIDLRSMYGRIHDIDLQIINIERSFPDVLVSFTPSKDLHRRNWPQLLLLNNQGTFEVKTRNPSLAGRAMDCTRYQGSISLWCFMTSYRNNSVFGTIEATAHFTDYTNKSGLPFPLPRARERHYGRFTIGATFLDYDGDGFDDLITVAQHAYIMVAKHRGQPGIPKFDIQYMGKRGEYLRVYAPENHLTEKIGPDAPACAYFSLEQAESRRSDFVKCFNREEGTWQHLLLPERVYMQYRPVEFIDDGDDGVLDFVVRNSSNNWKIYSILEK